MAAALTVLFSVTILPWLVGWCYGRNNQEPYSIRGRLYYREKS